MPHPLRRPCYTKQTSALPDKSKAVGNSRVGCCVSFLTPLKSGTQPSQVFPDNYDLTLFKRKDFHLKVLRFLFPLFHLKSSLKEVNYIWLFKSDFIQLDSGVQRKSRMTPELNGMTSERWKLWMDLPAHSRGMMSRDILITFRFQADHDNADICCSL